MAILTRDRLKPLLGAQTGPCVSIYIPTHRRHPEAGQNPIRFKNALKEAGRLLSDRLSPGETRDFLAPAAALATATFWRHQADGLAVLRSPAILEEFRLPLPVSELVVVADSFHVRPLIRSLNRDVRYFLVALSQKGVTVFQGTAEALIEVTVPDLPPGMLGLVPRRPTARAGSTRGVESGSGRRGSRAAAGAEVSVKDELVTYFRAADRAIARALRHEPVPVILAGVEYYLPIYRQVSRLKGLAAGAVLGSPDSMTPDELHARAWPVAEAVLRDHQERILERYRKADERGRSAGLLEDVVQQARRGRVRCLFVAHGVRVWGTVDPATGRIHRSDAQRDSHDDDVLDDVAEAVFAHGGEVVTLAPERMPGGREVAAELR